jgi:hypothetical protein
MSQEAEAPAAAMVEASTVAVATVATVAVVDEAMVMVATIMVAVESMGTTGAASRAHHLNSPRHPTHLVTRVEPETLVQAEQRGPFRRKSFTAWKHRPQPSRDGDRK